MKSLHEFSPVSRWSDCQKGNEMDFTPYFEQVFANYKKTYQDFMQYTDEQMPSDETLVVVALQSDMDVMLKEIERMKNNDV